MSKSASYHKVWQTESRPLVRNKLGLWAPVSLCHKAVTQSSPAGTHVKTAIGQECWMRRRPTHRHWESVGICVWGQRCMGLPLHFTLGTDPSVICLERSHVCFKLKANIEYFAETNLSKFVLEMEAGIITVRYHEEKFPRMLDLRTKD